MKNLTFSSPFVAQETVNLLNSSAFIIPPGTSNITLNPLKVKCFQGIFLCWIPIWEPINSFFPHYCSKKY